MRKYQAFSSSRGMVAESKSGALVSIIITGPDENNSEGTILSLAYKGCNIIETFNTNVEINIEKLLYSHYENGNKLYELMSKKEIEEVQYIITVNHTATFNMNKSM